MKIAPDLERRIADNVESGLYHSANEVIAEALRLLEQRDRRYAERLATLRADVAKGLREADSGALLDGEEVMDRLDARFAERDGALGAAIASRPSPPTASMPSPPT